MATMLGLQRTIIVASHNAIKKSNTKVKRMLILFDETFTFWHAFDRITLLALRNELTLVEVNEFGWCSVRKIVA